MMSRRRKVVPNLSILALALPVLSNCGAETDSQDDFAALRGAVTTRMGVDYSFARPAPAGLGAALYASATTGSGVVNHLRTTTSWFDCWTTGQLHGGDNTTWYHTFGDENGSWGYVPAVSLNTEASFDANPGYDGLRKCGE